VLDKNRELGKISANTDAAAGLLPTLGRIWRINRPVWPNKT